MEDEKIMQLALKLARKGGGKVSPNPKVGAIIVNEGKIVGSGYHQGFGELHAEINALKEAGKRAKGGTLYVNLEPCSYFGKTPPCTESIIKARIKKVICSIIDSNPQVNGKGVRRLISSGIQVEIGLLDKEAKRLNEVYLKYITTGRPFVILKIAQSLDGKIATQSGDSKWITAEDSREFVHKLRSQVDAVLVGSGTIIRDDPELTTHNVKGKNPKRIILTAKGFVPPDSKILRNDKDNRTIIVTPNSNPLLESVRKDIWTVKKTANGKIDLIKFLKKAGEEGLTSILVEGGKEIFTSFLKNKLVDKVYYFLSPRLFGKGWESFGDLGVSRVKESLNLKDIELKRFSKDFLLIGYP